MRTLREHLGQLFVIGFEGDSWNPSLEELLQEVRPGGVIFFQRNITTARSFHRLVRQIRDFLAGLSLPVPFLAIDLEGGTVDRLRDVLAPLPPAREVARAGLARPAGQMAGRELAAFSLNVDFAPVLDLASPESAEVLGSRTVGPSSQEVIPFASDFLEGLTEQGIFGCGKHFPGLGSGRVDSHQKMPRIEKEASQMWEEDLLPYRTLASRLPMVMVAHAWYPALEKAYALTPNNSSQPLPASLSPALVSGLLKGRLGYQGLILSDDLEMGGVREGRSIGEAAVAALRAGCDLLLICRRAENVREALETVLQEAACNPDFCALGESAAQKVLRAKQTLKVPGETSSVDWEGLRQQIHQFTAEVHRRLSTQPAVAEGRRSSC
ncbi:MAG: glycoside hydrolase family 3 protein [Acidobacteria bacterium]|nr:glycoside hydrolase family 3 protein [Acidobacteriota bacterium]